MPIKYSVSEKGNPSKPTEPKKCYANAKSSGEVSLKSLSKEIAQRSTVSPADTVAVLQALTEVMSEHLSEGEIVKLGEFGSFRISIGSEGAETSEKFSPALIKTKKVVYRPGTDVREMLNNLKFEKA